MRPVLLILLAVLAIEHLLQAQNIQMTNQSTLLADGGRVSWSVNNVIAYDHQELTGARAGYFDVYTMNPNGTGNTCLTCTGAAGASALPGLNMGNPKWSPDGHFIVFQAQALPSLGSAIADLVNFPGSGYNSELWATDTAGNFWQLTFQAGGTACSGSPWGGVIYPAFSWNGALLAWGQRINPSGCGFFQCWELAVAGLNEIAGVPSLSSTNIYTPGINHYYYEPHGFSLDNSTVFFMGNLDTGMQAVSMNIYSFNLGTQVLRNLTNTLVNWNEYPEPLPASFGSNKLIYMLYGRPSTSGSCASDYWVMNYDGTDNYQLTFFNTPGNP